MEFWRLQKMASVYFETKLKKTYAEVKKNGFKLRRILVRLLLELYNLFDIKYGS